MNENTFFDKKLNIAIYTDDINEYEAYKKILTNNEITLFTSKKKTLGCTYNFKFFYLYNLFFEKKRYKYFIIYKIIKLF